jgi:hypothetical protein
MLMTAFVVWMAGPERLELPASGSKPPDPAYLDAFYDKTHITFRLRREGDFDLDQDQLAKAVGRAGMPRGRKTFVGLHPQVSFWGEQT